MVSCYKRKTSNISLQLVSKVLKGHKRVYEKAQYRSPALTWQRRAMAVEKDVLMEMCTDQAKHYEH